MRSDFRDPVAYRRSRQLADCVWDEVLGWQSFDEWTIGIQLVRAADSVGANIAEAFGRQTTADRRRILYLARGSLYETEHWLASAVDRGLIPPEWHGAALTELAKTLNGLIRRPGRRP